MESQTIIGDHLGHSGQSRLVKSRVLSRNDQTNHVSKPIIKAEPIMICSLSYGYFVFKIPGPEPCFQIRLGSGTERDLLYQFHSFDEAAKYLDTSGICVDRNEAIKLLNKGDCNG